MKNEKHLEALTAVKDGDMMAIGSTEDEDRVGDVLKVSDWDLSKFKKNPVLQAGHDYRPQFTIGIAKDLKVEGKKLTFRPVFHSLTQLSSDIRAMFENKFLKAWSVGYIPGKDDGDKNELLEISAVAVPANPHALTLLKSMENLCKDEENKISNDISKWVQDKGCSCGDVALEKEEEKEVEEKPKESKEKETYDCECIECGNKIKSDKHCKDLKCSKCGGEMRRAERPGPGKDGDEIEKKEKAKKSPECRTDKETEDECVARKIPEIMKDDPKMEKDQAVAIALSMCKKKCEDKKKGIIKRWNKQLPKIFNSKGFDISRESSRATTFEYKLYTGYLDCEIRHLNLNNYLIPSPLLGSYLAGFKEILSNYKVIDERNFDLWTGTEEPINYEVIKLNSKEEDDFLVKGTRFYKSNKSSKKFIVKFEPCFYGLQAQIITVREDKEWNKNLLISVKDWVKKNNKLRGEAFCLSGEFIDRGNVEWKDIVLPDMLKGAVMKGASQLESKGAKAIRRGMMFIGKPGTGKTLTGKSMMANLKDKTFIWVSARDFEKMSYQKQSTLSLAFKMCRSLAPAVLFMEDIDAWMKDGRMMDLLKTEMDGLQENRGTITVLTSNTPEEFPDALLDRPGRFNDILEFELPNKELRKIMIMDWSGLKQIDTKDLNKLIEGTEGFSGAHMRELIDFAKMIKDEDKIEFEKALMISLNKIVKQRELISKIRESNKKNKDDEEKENSVEDKSVIKEGRVISGKNRKLIKDAILAQDKSTEALEKLLETSEPLEDGDKVQTPAKAEEAVDSKQKVEEPKKVDKGSLTGADEIALRTLQKINKVSNFGLNKLKSKLNG